MVSLVPFATETLLAWGIRPVAVTRFCEQPGYPTVGGTKNPDIGAIVALAPDLVIVDREENRAEDAAALESAGVRLEVLHIRHVSDVGPALTALRDVLGLPTAPPVLSPPPRPVSDRGRAWVPIWRRPWMTIGPDTYGSSLLEHIGVTNIFGREDAAREGGGPAYPEVTLDEVRDRHPDLVIAPSEPYAFAERHRAELESVAPVLFVDGKDLFWWGERTVSALRRLDRVVGKAGLARPGDRR